MEVMVKTKDFKVSQQLRDYVEDRLDRLDRFVGRGATAKLELTHERNRTGGDLVVAQLTIAIRQTLLRAEERHADARRAFDQVLEKIGSQLRRHHSKRTDRSRIPSLGDFAAALPEVAADDLAELGAIGPDGDDDERTEIVRTKRFALKPMTSQEAIDQLELLGHDFFVFLNADDNQVNVLYRRRSGQYGLIQPA